MSRFRYLTVFLLAVSMLFTNITTVFGDEYHSSITVKPDETLVKRDDNDTVTVFESGISLLEYEELDDCETDVILTPYASRNSLDELDIFIKPGEEVLPQQIKDTLEEAYDTVLVADTLDELTPEIITEANKKGVSVDSLVVRDIFDISKRYDGDEHYDPLHNVNNIDHIILKTRTLKNFVCLLHYKNGVWNVVPDVEILDDTTLRISVSSLSPFAIVISNEETHDEPSHEEEIIVEPIIEPTQKVEEEEPVSPVEPVEPISPVEPIEPSNPDDGHKCCGCIYHILIMITMIVTIIIGLIIKVKKEDEDDKLTEEEREDLIKHNKKIRKVRYLIMLINLVLCIIFYILGCCRLDIIALMIDIIMLIFFFMFTNKNSENEKQQ